MPTGNIHSIQTLGTLDGPGVRCVIFLQGCPLRCLYCHNPDTWERSGGTSMSAQEAMEKILRYKAYFGRDGGVTVSGGEVLLQPEFVTELFTRCHRHGIHTALDTSGCILSGPILRLLDVCDLCLLDIKACSEDAYRKLCGGSLKQTLRFLQTLDEKKIPTWVRQVIVPGYNDTPENIKNLKALAKPFGCIEKIELLPFRKLCVTKYEQLGVPFPLAEKPEATEEAVARLQAMLAP